MSQTDRPQAAIESVATRLPAALRLLRPHQWVKNAIVAAPLFFTPGAVSGSTALVVAAGIVCFCAAASAVYVINDWVDRDSDRLHSSKMLRPLANGAISPTAALVLFSICLTIALVGAFALSGTFALFVIFYIVLNIAYTMGLKAIPIIDVMTIAAGFVIRLEAGANLAAVGTTPWIIVMTALLALLLATAKRRDDLLQNLGADHRASLTGYNQRFLDATLSMVTGVVLVAYLIYTTDAAVIERLGTDKLFYTAPFVFFGLLRYLQITFVGERSGSPTLVLLTDPPILAAVLGWLVIFTWLLYF